MVQHLPESHSAAPGIVGSPTAAVPAPAFVGRARELAILRERLAAARRGEGGIVLLAGEPGIGKTRLAQLVAAEARAVGVAVLWGRAYEGDWSPPFGPWVEALGDHLRDLTPERRRAELERLGPGAASLAQFLPAVRAAVPNLPPPPALGPDKERFRLADAVANLLLAATAERPILLVLDDLQWADRGSLALLRYLLRILPRARLLILATLREAELDQGERRLPLTELLAALHREPGFARLPLSGLDERDVDAVVAAAVARTVSPALGRAIHGETGGNPFYVQEVIRHLLDEGGLVERDGAWTAAGTFRELGVPEGVRQVVHRRLARLPERTHALLGYASVFSGGADVRVLQEVTGLDESDLLDALDEVLAAGLIRPQPGKAETYDFSHAIIRHALYEERSPSRNVRRHRQVAEAMERLSAGQPAVARSHAAELAAQFHASASLPEAERGIPHALTAAELARAGFDRDGAVRFLRMARDLAAGADPETRAGIAAKLAVAEAEALELDAAAATAEVALAAFAESGAPVATIAAFLQEVAFALKSGGADAAVWRPLVERGLALRDEHDLTWARLSLLLDPIEPVAGTPLKAGIWRGYDVEAVRVARAEGIEDDHARTVESMDVRSLAETRELVRLGRGWRQPSAVLRALTVAANDLQYRHGAFTEAIALWEEQAGLSERYGATSWRANALFNLALLRLALGDFAAARSAERKAVALMTKLGPYREGDVLAMEMATSFGWYLEGDWPALAAYWSRFVVQPTDGAAASENVFSLLAGPLYAAMAALADVWVGSEEAKGEARGLLASLVPLLESIVPELGNQNQNGAVAFAAAAAWYLGATEHAAPLRRLAHDLLAAGIGDYPQTSLELTAARMAALRGDLAEATVFFAKARAALDASGQRPLRAIADYDEATVVLRAKGGDQARAAQLLEAARERFADQGMTGWARRAEEAQTELRPGSGRPVLPAGLTERELDVLRLVGRGYSDRQISEELYISTRTVNAHLRNMFAKTDVGNRTELSVWASAHGLLEASGDESRVEGRESRDR